MAFNINKLRKIKPKCNVGTKLGTLYIFSIGLKDQLSLIKNIGCSLDACDSLTFLKNLVVFICYPKRSLKEGLYRPDQPALSIVEIEKMNECDLEKIAKAYVECNESLYREQVSEEEVTPEGDRITKYEYGEVKFPRKKEENYIDYLYRLFDNDIKYKNSMFPDYHKSIYDLGSFSDGLADTIVENLSLGESLKNSIDSSFHNDFALSVNGYDSSPDISKILERIENSEEEKRLAPFKDLSKKFDELVGISNDHIKFIVDANRIQTKIASEIKGSGDSADRHSKINIRLTVFVVFLSVVGLAISVWASYAGVSFSEKQQSVLDEYSSGFLSSLEGYSISMRSEINESQIIMKDMTTYLERINDSITTVNQEEKSNSEKIHQLEIENLNYKRELRELRKKLDDIKMDDVDKGNN